MSLAQWKAELFRQLRLYGVPCTLSETEQRGLFAIGFTPDNAFAVASDVYCGFTFNQSAAANAA